MEMKKLAKLLAVIMTGGLLLAACGDAYNDDNEINDNEMDPTEEMEYDSE